jgi:hypothetical protein
MRRGAPKEEMKETIATSMDDKKEAVKELERRIMMK